MEVKKAIKKVIALSTGAAMVGSTIMGAMAADLSSYPSPFISKDGAGKPVFDAWLVVGDTAAPADIIGVTDIAVSLQSQMTEEVSAPSGAYGSAVRYATGDGVSISEPNDLLEIREKLGQVRETLTEFDLDGLRGGTVSTNEGTTDYNQYLRFQSSLNSSTSDYIASGQVFFDRDEDDVAGDYLFFRDGDVLFEYELEFEEGLKSNVECINSGTSVGAAGCAAGDQRRLRDLEDEQLTILGKPYTIVRTRVVTSTNQLILEMLGGDVIDTLEEGQTKTYTIDGKDYEVTAVIISDGGRSGTDTVKFNVNGELTRELVEGQTDVLKDGTEVGVREILANEAGEISGGDIVEFFLGANKVRFEDSDYTDSNFVSSVKVNEESIEDASIKIRATEPDANSVEIQDIRYRLRADATRGDVYVRPGQGLRQFLDEPEGMLNPDWDIRYEGLTKSGVSTAKLAARSSDSYDLIFENREGVHYNVPFMDNGRSRSGIIGYDGSKFGDDDNDLVMTEGRISLGATRGCVNGTVFSTAIFDTQRCIFNVDVNDFFVLTNTPQDETAFTHVLTYESIDTTNNQLTFNDEGTGQRKITYTVQSGSANMGVLGKADLVVGGFTHTIYVRNATHRAAAPDTTIFTGTAKNYPLAVDQDADGVLDLKRMKIVVNGGGALELNPGQDWTNATDPNLTVGGGAGGFVSATYIRNGTDFAGTTLNFGNQVGQADRHVSLNLTTITKQFDSNGVLGGAIGESINISVRAYTDAGRTLADVDVPSPQTFGDTVSDEGAANTGGVTRTVLDMVSLNEVDKLQGLSTYGVFFDLDQSIRRRNEGDVLTLEYPISQRGADVFVVTGKGSAVREGGSAGKSQVIHPLNVGVTKLASQVADVEGQNLLVVGGPCVNEVAAKLMDNPEPCAKDFEAGKALVKLYESDGKVAMLVAGYEAVDTTRASKWVAQDGGAKLRALSDGTKEVVLLTVSPEPTVQVASKK